MNPLTWLPIKDWCYIGLALAVAALGALFIHHERELGAAKAQAQLEHERASIAQVSAAAASAAQAESQRRETALQEIVNENQKTIAKISASVATNAADRNSFGVQLDTYIRSRAGSVNPSSASSGQAANDPLVVLAGLLNRADQRASDLAKLADERGAAGTACERAYESLTKK